MTDVYFQSITMHTSTRINVPLVPFAVIRQHPATRLGFGTAPRFLRALGIGLSEFDPSLAPPWSPDAIAVL